MKDSVQTIRKDEDIEVLWIIEEDLKTGKITISPANGHKEIVLKDNREVRLFAGELIRTSRSRYGIPLYNFADKMKAFCHACICRGRRAFRRQKAFGKQSR